MVGPPGLGPVCEGDKGGSWDCCGRLSLPRLGCTHWEQAQGLRRRMWWGCPWWLRAQCGGISPELECEREASPGPRQSRSGEESRGGDDKMEDRSHNRQKACVPL